MYRVEGIKGRHSELLKRSTFGLVRVYNNLPGHVVACASVSEFQSSLQHMVKDYASRGAPAWASCLNAGSCMEFYLDAVPSV